MTLAPRSSGKAPGTATDATTSGRQIDSGRPGRRRWYQRVGYVSPLVAMAVVVAVMVALGVRGSENTSPRSGTGNPTSPTNPYGKAFGSFEPVTASGSAGGTIPLPAGARVGIITATYAGRGFFDVGFSRGTNAFPLINWAGVRGPYHGTVTFGLFDKPQADSLTVWAGNGQWHVTIAPISSAAELPTAVKGTGDAVYRYSGERTRWMFRKRDSTHMFIIQAAPRSAVPARAYAIHGSSKTLYLGGFGPTVVAVSTDGGAWSATAK